MRKNFFVLFFLLTAFLILPTGVLAKIGVGVGTGKIQVDEKLRPGIIYQLPSLTVLNTGDEESDYGVLVSFNEKQSELKPKEEWFIFSPQKFHLKPTEVKMVDIKLNLPLRMDPGDYFVYLEARPVTGPNKGGVSIGIAAAAKLYFTVVPANPVLGAYYKVFSFFKVYAPWPQRVLAVIGIILILVLFKKFFNLNIGLKKSPDKNRSDKKDE